MVQCIAVHGAAKNLHNLALHGLQESLTDRIIPQSGWADAA